MKPEQARPFAPLPFSSFITTTIWSAAIVLCILHNWGLSTLRATMTSLVPYKRLWCIPASFTPDVIWPLNRLRVILRNGCKRNHPLSTSSIALRGFDHWFKFFSSASITCRNQCSRFSLSFTTLTVSNQCSIMWFANYPCRSSAEGHSFIRWEIAGHSVRSNSAHLINTKIKVFHHLYSIHSCIWVIQDTHVSGLADVPALEFGWPVSY